MLLIHQANLLPNLLLQLNILLADQNHLRRKMLLTGAIVVVLIKALEAVLVVLEAVLVVVLGDVLQEAAELHLLVNGKILLKVQLEIVQELQEAIEGVDLGLLEAVQEVALELREAVRQVALEVQTVALEAKEEVVQEVNEQVLRKIIMKVLTVVKDHAQDLQLVFSREGLGVESLLMSAGALLQVEEEVHQDHLEIPQ